MQKYCRKVGQGEQRREQPRAANPPQRADGSHHARRAADHRKDLGVDGDNVCGCDEPSFKRYSDRTSDLFLHPRLRDCFLHHVRYL